jgi:spermidine synthase
MERSPEARQWKENGARESGFSFPLAYFTVFCSGAAVLMLEILGARLVGPFYGTSLHVWAAMISTTLVALSIGYWVGGILADRWRGASAGLHGILLLSALLVGILPLYLQHVLLLSYRIAGFEGGILLSATILFIPSLFLLGMVSPYVVRAAFRGEEKTGRTVGSLYAVSTIGSVIGALTTAFVLIPRQGSLGCIWIIATTILLPAIVWKSWKTLAPRVKAVAVLIVTVLPTLMIAEGMETAGGQVQMVYRSESVYGEIRIVDDMANDWRLCLLDGSSQNWVRRSQPSRSLLRYAYLLERQLGPLASPGERALIIGLGGGVIPMYLRDAGLEVDIVEINPDMVKVARRYFDFAQEDFNVYVQDGRTFLKDTPSQLYDFVVLDVAGGGTQPWHLFTKEAFEEVRKTMTPDGLLVVNLLGFAAGEYSNIPRAVWRTLQEVFPEVIGLDTSSTESSHLTSLLIFASAIPFPNEIGLRERLHGGRVVMPPSEPGLLLTDDHNPMDLWSATVNIRLRESVVAAIGEKTLLR